MFRPRRAVLNPLRQALAPQTQARSFWRRTPKAPKYEQQVIVQPVRIRTWYSTKRLATVAMYAGGAYVVTQWLLAATEVAVEEVEGEDEAQYGAESDIDQRSISSPQEAQNVMPSEQGQGPQELPTEEFVEDDDAMFIPLTLASKLPREYYRGSDPEWQEFRKFAKDKERTQKLYKELCGAIVASIKQHKQTSVILGKDIKIRRYWLDAIFPQGPPQDYSRKGIAIGDNYVAIAEQIISAEEYERSHRMLWPSGVTNGLYQFWNTIFVFQWRRVKESLGLDTTVKPGSFEQRLDRMMQMLKAKEMTQESEQDTQPAVTTSATTEEIDLKPSSKWYVNGIPAVHGDSTERAVATFGFLHAIMNDKKVKNPEPPRGNFIIYGMLQATGGRAYGMFDVTAFYDPKTEQFTSVTLQAKSVKTWNQAPRGGP